MQDYRKLDAWQKAHSINIAEGCYRGQRSLAQSLRIALGSAGELEYYVILAGDLKLLSESDRKIMAAEVSEVKAVTTGFMKAVNAAIDAEDKAARRLTQTVNGKRQTVNGKR